MGRKPSGGVPVKLRRKNVIDRLQKQLDMKGYVNQSGELVRLSESGAKRINKEIAILKTRT